MDCIADISLVLYVTMAINSLKLYELINLALPLIVILIIQTFLMILFAWGVYFLLFGKDYDSVMLAVGGIGFAMGATANGLANMQSLIRFFRQGVDDCFARRRVPCRLYKCDYYNVDDWVVNLYLIRKTPL